MSNGSSIQGSQVQARLTGLSIKSKVATFDIIESKSNYLDSLSIYTSIFSPLIRMTVILIDFYDIIKAMKLIGNEEIKLTFRYGDDKKKDTEIYFRLNSILDGTRLVNEKSGSLVLDCVSHDYYNFYTKVSKRLKGKSNSIIQSLMNDVVKTNNSLFFDSGNTDLDLQSNYKSVLECINLVCKNDNKFFYQDLDGYYLKSFDTFNSQSNKGNLLFLVDQKSWIYSDVVKSYGFDYWNNEVLLEKNVLHPSYINLDRDKYKINQTDKKFSDIGNSNFFKDLETNITVENVYGDINNKMFRQISSYNLHSNTITVKLNGYEKRRIGDKLKLEYRGRDEIDVDHPLYSGDWIITDIRNEIGVSDYLQTIKLAKVKYYNL